MTTASSRAQSETIGFVLVFALVIAGAGITVAIGGSGIVDTQSGAEFQRAENSMTLFDSRAAMVALGDSGAQTVSLGQDSGQVSVDEDTGWLRVTHRNYTGEDSSHKEVIFNETLGSVVYEGDSGTLAYQGGGVWQTYGSGNARMVSPPEFHYRGATLTLPAIQVFGSGSASGTVDMNIRPRQQARLVYPNRTAPSTWSNTVGAPYNETAETDFRNYTNPVRNGTVNVTVNSEYADGWESYFRQRTTGEVNRDGDTVTLTLETTSGAPGPFEMPNAGDSVNAGAIAGGHPLTDFEVTLDITKNKPHFSFYAEEDPEEFEIHVYSDVNPKNNDCDPYGSKVNVNVYYYDGNSDQEYESWESAMVDPQNTDGMEWVCDGDDTKLRVDFISDDITMTYDRIGQNGNFDPGMDDPNTGESTGVTRGNKWAFNDRINDQDGFSLKPQSVWDQHPEVGYEDPGKTFQQNGTDPDTQPLREVTNHYLGRLDGEIDLIAKDGPGNSDSINEGGSSGVLLYEENAGAQFVTFLHITENEIQVDLD
jgi:hypothetical protein